MSPEASDRSERRERRSEVHDESVRQARVVGTRGVSLPGRQPRTENARSGWVCGGDGLRPQVRHPAARRSATAGGIDPSPTGPPLRAQGASGPRGVLAGGERDLRQALDAVPGGAGPRPGAPRAPRARSGRTGAVARDQRRHGGPAAAAAPRARPAARADDHQAGGAAQAPDPGAHLPGLGRRPARFTKHGRLPLSLSGCRKSSQLSIPRTPSAAARSP
jgi:hypothetical protein